MFAAFLEAGDLNSQVIFGLQDRVVFQRSQLADGSSALSGGGTNSNEGEPKKRTLDVFVSSGAPTPRELFLFPSKPLIALYLFRHDLLDRIIIA